MKDNIYIGFTPSGYDGHDLSFTLIDGRNVYAIELEKILKLRHYKYVKTTFGFSFDHLVNKCLNYFIENIKLSGNKFYVINNEYIKIKGKTVFHEIIENHHLLHAFSTFCPSGFYKSAVLTLDYYGSNIEDGKKMRESQVMWYFDNMNYKKLHSFKFSDDFSSFGIGAVYVLISELIGLEEGSVMGLSSYGNYKKYSQIKLFGYRDDDVFFNQELLNLSKVAKSYIGNLEHFSLIEILRDIYGVEDDDYTSIINNEVDICNSKFADIAAHLQFEVENAIVYLANRLYDKTKCKNLCLAGGVALNILANTKILEKTPFKNIFIQPAANDGGISLGAAYYGYHILGGNKDRINLISPGLGIDYSNEIILSELKKYENFLKYEYKYNIEDITGELLSKKKIIGWFQGRSEFGPRALGYRSILADPRDISVRDKVNVIKNRQKWRPLAPVIMEEHVKDYFILGIKSPYMTFSSEVVLDKKSLISGVVHVDGTARYQTVNAQENESYYNLIKEFEKYTNIPILINTSFNVSGQAIVESPVDAIETFLATQLDYLVIGNYIVSKTQVYDNFKFNHEEKIFDLSFENDQLKKLFYRNWHVLKELFFGNNYKVDFYFKEDLNFYFNVFVYNKSYKIVLSKVLDGDNKGYYFKHNGIGLGVIIGSNYKGVFSDEFKMLLDSIKLKIERNHITISKILGYF